MFFGALTEDKPVEINFSPKKDAPDIESPEGQGFSTAYQNLNLHHFADAFSTDAAVQPTTAHGSDMFADLISSEVQGTAAPGTAAPGTGPASQSTNPVDTKLAQVLQNGQNLAIARKSSGRNSYPFASADQDGESAPFGFLEGILHNDHFTN